MKAAIKLALVAGFFVVLYCLIAVAVWDPFWMSLYGIKTGLRILAGAVAFAMVLTSPILLFGASP